MAERLGIGRLYIGGKELEACDIRFGVSGKRPKTSLLADVELEFTVSDVKINWVPWWALMAHCCRPL